MGRGRHVRIPSRRGGRWCVPCEVSNIEHRVDWILRIQYELIRFALRVRCIFFLPELYVNNFLFSSSAEEGSIVTNRYVLKSFKESE